MKKIKFPLEMADGFQARELEELQRYFDLEKAIGYFNNGKLQKWLENTYNDDILDEIEQLTGEEDDFVAKFTQALGVDCVDKELDVKEVLHKSSLREELKEFFSNQKIEDILSYTVETQEQLQNLCNQRCKKIYLFRNKFYISKEIENIEFIGVDNPQVEIEVKDRKDFIKQKIRFTNVEAFDEETKKLIMADDYQNVVMNFLDVMEAYIESVQ